MILLLILIFIVVIIRITFSHQTIIQEVSKDRQKDIKVDLNIIIFLSLFLGVCIGGSVVYIGSKPKDEYPPRKELIKEYEGLQHDLTVAKSNANFYAKKWENAMKNNSCDEKVIKEETNKDIKFNPNMRMLKVRCGEKEQITDSITLDMSMEEKECLVSKVKINWVNE